MWWSFERTRFRYFRYRNLRILNSEKKRGGRRAKPPRLLEPATAVLFLPTQNAEWDSLYIWAKLRFLTNPWQLNNVMGWHQVVEKDPDFFREVSIYPVELLSNQVIDQWNSQVAKLNYLTSQLVSCVAS